MFLTTPSSASRTLQSRFSNLKFSLFQTSGKDYNIPPGFILLTVWKITTLDESNEFPLTMHLPVGIGNSQPASFVFLSMVFTGFRTIPAMNVVKIKQLNLFMAAKNSSLEHHSSVIFFPPSPKGFKSASKRVLWIGAYFECT